MNSDFLFLVFFLLQLIGIIVIRLYYGWKSPDRKKSFRELTKTLFEYEGRLSLGLLILAGMVLVVALIIYIFYTPFFAWLVLPFPDWLRWIGVITGFVSLFLLWWVHSTLGQAYSKALTIQEQHQVVDKGPYRHIRHPMYTGFLIYFLSWFLLSANILFIISWFLILLALIARIPQEEEMLIAQFGDDYRTYMKRTGRLVPPLRKKDDTDTNSRK